MHARSLAPVLVALAAGLGLGLALRGEEPASFAPQGFAFELEARVPGTPEQVYDLFTGDVSPWWDHRFSERPLKLELEPRPGGAFVEIFDAAGNGAEHARVTVAERGKELVFRGPLGFGRMGVHLDFVHRVTFEPDGAGTKVRIGVHGLGEVQAGWPAAVRDVWQHFLGERFQPYATEQLGR